MRSRDPSISKIGVDDVTLGSATVSVNGNLGMKLLSLSVPASSVGAPWGAPRAPLLPAALREAWRGERMPSWIAVEARLPGDFLLSDLDARVWDLPRFQPDRVQTYITRLVRDRFRSVEPLRAITTPWPRALDPRVVAWRVRTINGLERAGLLGNVARLERITFAELADIRAMGIRSLLDVAAGAESAIAEVSTPIDIGTARDVMAFCRDLSEQPWVEYITDEDPRFSALLVPGYASLTEQIEFVQDWAPGNEAAWTSFSAAGRQAAALARSFQSIAAAVTHVTSLSLEAAIRDYLAALFGSDDARLDVLIARLGAGGAEPLSLRRAGAIGGMSGERVRQWQAAVLEARPSHPPYMPQLDRAIEQITGLTPSSADDASKALQMARITERPFHPTSVFAVAEFCRRSSPFTVEESQGRSFVTTTPTLEHLPIIASIAGRQASAYGVSNVSEVAVALEDKGVDLPDDAIHGTIATWSSASFLDDEWFWMPEAKPQRNRLRNVTRLILSVASPLDVRTLRDGIRRRYTFRRLAVLPPRHVLLSFYREHPEFDVLPGEVVHSVDALDYRVELGETERIFVEVLRSSPAGVLDRTSFLRACLERGMNANTFSVYTTYSPILDHLATDVWALRGLPVDTAAVEALRAANADRERERRMVDYGWSAEGTLWVASRIPELGRGGAVFSVPSAIKHYVAGRTYKAKADDGTPAGTIVVGENGSSWGYGPYLHRRGADAGDIMRIDFHLDSDDALLQLGSDELLDS